MKFGNVLDGMGHSLSFINFRRKFFGKQSEKTGGQKGRCFVLSFFAGILFGTSSVNRPEQISEPKADEESSSPKSNQEQFLQPFWSNENDPFPQAKNDKESPFQPRLKDPRAKNDSVFFLALWLAPLGKHAWADIKQKRQNNEGLLE